MVISMKTICVVGLGYIGLPTASLLAVRGYGVHGVDVCEDIVSALNNGEVLIHEPGLKQMVQEAVAGGNLHATVTATEADVFILALPTPFKDGHKPDLSFVQAAVTEVAPFVKPGNIIILESTSPVGSTELVCDWLQAMRPDLNIPGHEGGFGEQIYLAHCPERVLPGRILQELVENDRIVGGVDASSTKKIAEFYRTVVKGQVLETNSRTAELSKLAENTFRDVNIAYANELSMICHKLSMDVNEVINLANRHPRVNILNPGCGVGGHCIAVDPWFIVDAAPELSRLIQTARETNYRKTDFIYERILEAVREYDKPTIACMGIAFKPNIDDLRESPALDIVHKIAKNIDCSLLVIDPFVKSLPAVLSGYRNVVISCVEDALEHADIIVFLTGHDVFRSIIDKMLNNKKVIDACGVVSQKSS